MPGAVQRPDHRHQPVGGQGQAGVGHGPAPVVLAGGRGHRAGSGTPGEHPEVPGGRVVVPLLALQAGPRVGHGEGAVAGQALAGDGASRASPGEHAERPGPAAPSPRGSATHMPPPDGWCAPVTVPGPAPAQSVTRSTLLCVLSP